MFDDFLNIADQAAAENDLPHYSARCAIYIMGRKIAVFIFRFIPIIFYFLQIFNFFEQLTWKYIQLFKDYTML